MLRFCSEGNFEEVSWLLHSEKDGAAVNATFAEMLVRCSHNNNNNITELRTNSSLLRHMTYIPRYVVFTQ